MLKGNNKSYDIDKTFKYDCKDEFISINEQILLSVNNNNNPNDFRYKIYVCIFTKTGFKPAISEEVNLDEFLKEGDYNNNNERNFKEISMSNKTFNNIIIKYNAKEICKTVTSNDNNNNIDNDNAIVNDNDSNLLKDENGNYIPLLFF